MTYQAPAGLIPPALTYGPDKTLSLFLEDYVKFKGFSTREEFWWPLALILTLQLTIAAVGAAVVATMFAEDLVTDAYHPFGFASITLPFGVGGEGALFALAVASLMLIIAALTVFPLLAVTWRRLHDTGLPGSMAFLGLIPVVGWLVVLALLARPSAPTRHHAEWAESKD